MVEANKAKMASAGARPASQVPTGQQGSILGYVTRGATPSNKAANATAVDKDKKDGDAKPACDEDSQRGRFGWVTLGKCHIPYILRLGEKYCAVRMVEMKLLNKYFSYLHSDIYSCTCIRSYYITESEARLLSEINMKHCEGQFGRDPFTSKDLVVRFQDAGEFYNFLDVCYNKLLVSSSNPKDKCGFIRINGESVVPYTVRDGLKYVPLFYFEGETDNLKLKAEKLEGWDLAYLKFCCKVQGIRNELFASETCSVISLSDIKSYFPPGTVFEDYWPNKVVDSQLLLPSNKGAAMVPSGGMWTRQPKLPPPQQSPVSVPPQHQQAAKVVVTTSTVQRTAPPAPVASMQQACNGWSGLVGGQPTFQPSMAPPAVRMAAQTPISMHNLSPTTNTGTRQYNPARPRPGHQYYLQAPTQPSHMSVTQPPPLVRVTGAGTNLGVAATTYASSPGLNLPSVSPSSLHLMGLTEHAMLPPPPHHYSQAQRHTPPANQSKFPPPLIPVNGTTRYGSGVYQGGTDVIDLSSPPQSPHRSIVGNGRTTNTAPSIAMANSANTSNSVGSSNSSMSPGSDPTGGGRKLIPIQEFSTSGNHVPYQVQKALVDNKMVPCINSKPFIYSELLMTLPDLVSHFFPTVHLSSCRQVLQDVLGLELYRGNRQQMQILRDSGKCQSANDVLPLIHLRDVMQYMPQMKYMFSRMSSEESPCKRARTS